MAIRICDFPGCNKPGRNKGFYNGKTRYDHFCESHHRTGHKFYQRGKRLIDNSKCQNCGWDKSYCDRHRIDPSKGYRRSNVLVLCPNCHRLVTVGLLKSHSYQPNGG